MADLFKLFLWGIASGIGFWMVSVVITVINNKLIDSRWTSYGEHIRGASKDCRAYCITAILCTIIFTIGHP